MAVLVCLSWQATAAAQGVDLYGDPLPSGAVARLGTVRYRLASQKGLYGLAFLPDNKTVLSAGGQDVQFWNAASGKLLREFSTAPLTIHSFAMAPDRKRIAVAGTHPRVGGKSPAEIRVLDLASGKTLQTLARGESRDVFKSHLAFSADGTLLFSIGYGGNFHGEDIASGKELLRKKMPNDYAQGLVASADGRHLALASGPNSRKLFLWKWDEEEPRALAGPERVQHIAFSPDGKLLAAVSESPSRLHVWDVAGRRLLYQRSPDKDYPWFSRLMFTPDGKTLLLPHLDRNSSGRGKTELLEPATGQSQGFLEAVSSRMAVSPDSHALACVTGRALSIWDLAKRKQVAGIAEAHASAPSLIRVSPRGLVVTTSEDNSVRIWDAATGKQQRVHQFAAWVRDIALSPDTRVLAASCFDDTVRLFAMDDGREIYCLPGHGRYGGRRTLAFTPDGRSLLSFGDDFYLRRWDVRTGRALAEHAIRPKGVDVPEPDNLGRDLFELALGSAAVTPDGKTFLLDVNGAYHFFDTASGKETRALGHEEKSFTGGALTISPDGKYLLASTYGQSATQTHDLYLRDWASGEYTKITLPGTRAGPVAFSADSRSFAAAASEPDEIRIFETVSGHERRRISGFRGHVESLAFFPDGRRLASGHSDSTVLIWDLTVPAKE